MHGKRVNVGDHWVDLVLPGFPESHYRVISDNMRATYMIHEIAKACVEMGKVKTGALIVVEHHQSLTEYERTGIDIDGVVYKVASGETIKI